MVFWKTLLKQGLDDDGWEWDWTTLGAVDHPERKLRAEIVAKSEGVWAASDLAIQAENLSEELGGRIIIRSRAKEGSKLKVGQVVCAWMGPARMVLALERPFLNLAAYTGGIALATRLLVDQVEKAWKLGRHRGAPPRVTSTRKILPGYRDLAIHGVRAGGGVPHRISLSGGVLIKENHIAAAGGIARAIQGARAVAPHGLKIEIEVRDERELAQAMSAGADVVMLDNFNPAQVKRALSKLGTSKPTIEVSGGIHLGNIGDYALPGVDVISTGSITHSVRSIDLSLLVR